MCLTCTYFCITVRTESCRQLTSTPGKCQLGGSVLSTGRYLCCGCRMVANCSRQASSIMCTMESFTGVEAGHSRISAAVMVACSCAPISTYVFMALCLVKHLYESLQNCEKPLLASSCLSVSPSALKNSAPSGRFLMKFHI